MGAEPGKGAETSNGSGRTEAPAPVETQHEKTPAPGGKQNPLRLRNAAFTRVWAGSIFSSVSSRTLGVAYPLLALALTGSPALAGWASFTLTLPILLFYVPAGVLVDRVDPRSLMLFTETFRGLAVTSLLLAFVLGVPSMPHVLAAAFLEGTLWVFYTLAETALLPSLVLEEQVTRAMARSETGAHIAVLAGRPLGGLLFGIAHAVPFALDAVLFLTSTLCLLGQTSEGETPGGRRHRQAHAFRQIASGVRELAGRALLAEMVDGVRELARHRFLRRAMALTTVTNLMVNTLIMIFIAGSANLSPLEVGLVLAAGGVGGVLGSSFAPSVKPRRAMLFTQMWIWVFALSLAALGEHPLFFGLATLMTGYTGARNNVAIRSFEIHAVDRSKLARVTSVHRLAVYGAVCLAAPLGGVLVSAFGTHEAAMKLFKAMFAIAIAVTATRFLRCIAVTATRLPP